MSETLHVVAMPNPFNTDRIVKDVDPGQTLREILADLQPVPDLQHARILIGDKTIPEGEWETYRPAAGQSVVIRVIPAGSTEQASGVSKFGGMLGIFIVVAGIMLSLGGLVGPGLGLIGIGIGVATAGFGCYTVLNLLAPGGSTSTEEDRIYSVRGSSNQALPWGLVPVVLGKHLVTPPFAALPYTEICGSAVADAGSGADQYLRQLFAFGYVPMTVEDIKIGDTAIASFDEVEDELLDAGEEGTLYPSQVTETSISLLLEYNAAELQTTEDDADEVSVDLTFQSGLFEVSDGGAYTTVTVGIKLEYSVHDAGSWTTWATLSIKGKVAKTLRYSYRKVLPSRAQYDIRITRTATDGDPDDGVYDDVYWTAIRTITNEDPVAADVRTSVVRYAMRVKATDQFSGAVDQLNAVCTSQVPVYDGTGSGAAEWASVAESQNPAALMLYMLRGDPNPRPVPDARIDWPAFEAWYTWCVTTGHTCNAVLTAAAPLKTVLQQIAGTGRASLSIRDGKYSVVYDHEQTTPVQLFTPRNSWGFESTKNFVDRPHALRVQFISEEAGWQSDEVIVYDDGYSAVNATEFQTVEMWGVTDADQAWKDGRYQLAAIKLRPEVMSFHADLESLVCQRGDLIRLQHDVPMVGICSGRIAALTIVGGYVTKITGDEVHSMVGGSSYVLRIRKASGTIVEVPVNTAAGESKTLTLTTPIAVASAPAVGDLYAFGLYGEETLELLIVGIEMGRDLDARLSCIEYNAAVYTADSGEIPAYNPHVTLPSDYIEAPTAPVMQVRSDGTVLLRSGADYVTQMYVSLAPGGSNPQLTDHYQLQYRETSTDSSETWATIRVEASSPHASITNVIDGTSYDVRARAVSPRGANSAWTAIVHVVEGKTAPPSDVTGVDAVLSANSGVVVTWTAVADLDVARYEVRVGASWAAGTPVYVGDSTQFVAGFLAAATYTYWVKAIDTTGHQSTTAGSDSITIGATNVATPTTGGTVTPSIPVITEALGVYRGAHLVCTHQADLSNFARFEWQVSDDNATWYSLKFDFTDWKDTLNADTDWPTTLLSHPSPLVVADGAATGRTLYYRVRRVTSAGVASSWSTAATLTTLAVEDGTLALDIIGTNQLKASSVVAAKIAAGEISAREMSFADDDGTPVYDGYDPLPDGGELFDFRDLSCISHLRRTPSARNVVYVPGHLYDEVKTEYDNPSALWIGLGCIGVHSAVTNLLGSPENLAVTPWTYSPTDITAELSSLTFGGKVFTKLTWSATSKYCEQTVGTGLTGIFAACAALRKDTKTKAWVYVYNSTTSAYVMQLEVNWTAKTVTANYGTKVFAHWAGDDIVVVYGLTSSVASAATLVAGIRDATETGSLYATAVMVADSDYVVPYTPTSRAAGYLSYGITPTNTGTFELDVLPWFNYDTANTKWILCLGGAAGAAANSVVLVYDPSTDKWEANIWVDSSNYRRVRSTTAITTNAALQVKQHIKVTYDIPNQTIRMWVDGVEQTSTASAGTVSSMAFAANLMHVGGLGDTATDYTANAQIADLLLQLGTLDYSTTHATNAVPWYDPSEVTCVSTSVRITKSGIRMRNAILDITDDYGREILISNADGLLAKDAAGTVIHDIPTAPILAGACPMGHFYEFKYDDAAYTVVASVVPTLSDWNTGAQAVTGGNDVVRGAKFKVYVYAASAGGTTPRYINVFLRPYGSSWGTAYTNMCPALGTYFQGDTSWTAVAYLRGMLDVPLSSDFKFDWYCEAYVGGAPSTCYVYLQQLGVWI